MLIGEPGKRDNKIVTVPHLKKIRTEDIDGKLVFLNYSNLQDKIRHLCKSQETIMLSKGDSMVYKLPPELQEESHVADALSLNPTNHGSHHQS